MHTTDFTPSQICFGLNLELDRQSFSCFLQLAGRPEFADLLAARLTSAEIEQHVDFFTGLLRKYLSKSEYHQIFLGDNSHQHHAAETQE